MPLFNFMKFTKCKALVFFLLYFHFFIIKQTASVVRHAFSGGPVPAISTWFNIHLVLVTLSGTIQVSRVKKDLVFKRLFLMLLQHM